MGRPKSFLQRVEVDQALRAHACQHNPAHRIAAGERRLKLTVGRTHEHYCVACALAFLERDIERLQGLKQRLGDGE